MSLTKTDPAIENKRREREVILQDLACAEYAHQQDESLSIHDLIFSTADNLINDGKVCECRECAAMESARRHLFPEAYRVGA